MAATQPAAPFFTASRKFAKQPGEVVVPDGDHSPLVDVWEQADSMPAIRGAEVHWVITHVPGML